MRVVFVIIYILLIAGFVLLIKGADFLVKGASSIARIFNISDLVIGLTIVAFVADTATVNISLITILYPVIAAWRYAGAVSPFPTAEAALPEWG